MNYLKIRNLSHPQKGFYGIGASATEYNDQYPQYLRITDIDDNCNVSTILPTCVDINVYPKWNQYLLKVNDIVFARTGNSTGRNYFCKKIKKDTVFAGFLVKFSINPELVIPNYVGYYCQSPSYWKQIRAMFIGSTRANINAKQYADLLIPIVDRTNQHHIVNTIGSVDNLIENYQSQIEKIIKIGDHLLITDSNKKSIIEYVDVLLGGTPSRKHLEYWNGDIKWINSGAITGTPAILKESDFITIDGVKHSATKSANKGDTVLSIIEPSKSKVALILDDNVYFNQSVICFSSKNKLDKGFIFFASRSLIEEIKGYATGAAQQSLNKKMIEKSKIHVPNQKTKIKLNNFFYSIISLEEKIRKLTILKEMLLLKYF
ncbi:restriction endonuclease subunit S [Metamycoplasma hyosynoviae]|uniref:restriction endonuclease subunit S n=2 Tax=Metamycoplasma hyosynoviae TaxID=29559 RepID=UPI002358B3F7|nr:restriction endonuclease subunit S [Metamycoplasma hyosynoviae]MDC8919113.1 restriction endonuclease subunit S [Metamycoplasma hyosynoviae]